MNHFLIVLFAFPILTCSKSFYKKETQDNKIKMIYGDDDRLDFYQISDQVRKNQSSGVALIVDKSFFVSSSPFYSDLIFKETTLDQEVFKKYGKHLCKQEKFRDQINPGYCTGFLIGKRLVATASHCVDNDLEDIRFVFNLSIKSENQPISDYKKVAKENIYYPLTVVSARKDYPLELV